MASNKTKEDSSPTIKIKVMTYNLQQLYDMGPKTWWDQVNRAARIPHALKALFSSSRDGTPDVLILNEAFNSYATQVCMALKDVFPYQTPVIGKSTEGWTSTTGKSLSRSSNWRQNVTINGGVVILSRYEILEPRQYLYHAAHASTWDCWSNKGVAYAKVQVPPDKNNSGGGGIVHVLGTHLQADEGHVPYDDTHQVRMEQLRELRTFVTVELQLPKTERVIIAGDLNVEYTTEAYRIDLETQLRATLRYEHTLPGSFSAPHNWMTRANARANQQSEDRNETLDYILVFQDYAQPKNGTGMVVVVPMKSAESWYWRYLAQQWPDKTDPGVHSDLSDHYPVLASFEF